MRGRSDFGELYITSACPAHWLRPGDDLRGAPLPESAQARQVERLDQPMNGSRNL